MIREATPGDAPQLLELKLQLDSETTSMMLEPGERSQSIEAERRAIQEAVDRPNSTILIAAGEGEITGYLEVTGGEFRRNAHVGVVVIGVRRASAGRGIGTQLFQALERWATPAGITRLELTVLTDNKPAIHLYQKMGFEIEGTRRASMNVAGDRKDEYWMARLLTS
ncbi:MAG: N-acetyltransferase family protein [Chloroflexota bacterium]